MGTKSKVFTKKILADLIIQLMNDSDLSDMAEVEAAIYLYMVAGGFTFKPREEVEIHLNIISTHILAGFPSVQDYFFDRINSMAIDNRLVAIRAVEDCLVLN